MKKLIAILLTLAMILSLAACNAKTPAATDPTDKSNPTDAPTETPTETKGDDTEPADTKPAGTESIMYFCINLGDLSFNDLGWKGCQDAAAKYGWTAEVIELGKDTSVYENAFLDALDSGKYTIVVSQSNFGLSDLCIKYAPEYKDIKFITYDLGASTDISTIDNMFGISFKQNEGSFLAGALAGKLTKSNKIGIFLFNDVPVGNDFATGYIAGVRYSNPEAKISVAYGNGSADASKLQEVSSAMFDSGVDVIYGVSGSAYPGLAKEATRRGGFASGIYAIGVDSDMWTVYKASENADIADVIITSMQKKVDEAVLYTLDRYVEGTLPFGTVEGYGILENGVGMADNEWYRANTPADVLTYMDALTEDVVSGKVEVPSYFDFADYDAFAAWRDQ